MKKEQAIGGVNPVFEALEAEQPISRIWLQQEKRAPWIGDLRRHCKRQLIPLSIVPEIKLRKMAGGGHQGVAMMISPIQYYRLEDVIPGIYERGETPLLFALDGVTDQHNLGAIARTAWIAGFHAVAVPVQGTATVTEDAVKISSGALVHLPICRESSMATIISHLKLHGIRVLGTAANGDLALPQADLTQPTVVVMGSEGEGLSPAVLRECDALISIPQMRQFDSYNVSVSAGMVAYESIRQRQPE